MLTKRYLLYIYLLFTNLSVCFAAPNKGVQGKLIFLGVNHDSTTSVWLSLTNAAGSFQLRGPGQQLIDAWTKDQRGLQLSLSPVVSNGNGGTHHLINATNNKKLDSQNQSGGNVFPPFPSNPPGIPTYPIIIPPGFAPGTPTHPIIIPPGIPPSGGTSTPGPNQSPSTENAYQAAPVTPARQIDENAWNVWSDNYYYGIRDGRNDVDTNGDATNFTVGADRHLTNRLVGGLSLANIHLNASAYNGGLENNVRGYKGGPYLGYQVSERWAINGSVNFGQFDNQNAIASLNSSYTTTLINTTLQAVGLYQFGAYQIRPEPLISYSYFRNPTYDFVGTLNSTPIQITRNAEQFQLGIAEFKVENNYTNETANGNIHQLYTEIGVDYAFTRPTDDQIYSGNLALGNVPEVSGLVTLGIRSILAKKLMIQASGSYLSIGANDLDLWDARLLVSYSFG